MPFSQAAHKVSCSQKGFLPLFNQNSELFLMQVEAAYLSLRFYIEFSSFVTAYLIDSVCGKAWNSAGME